MIDSFPVTTRGPRLTYIRSGRTSVKTYEVVYGGMRMWHKPERQSGMTPWREVSASYQAKYNRRHRAAEKSKRIETSELPMMRGDFLLTSVENPSGEGPRVIVAQCTGQYCSDAPGSARFDTSAWIGSAKQGRMRCKSCSAQLRAAIHRAVSARSRGDVPAVNA